ncbi:hypothetical protein [Actinomadura sp. NPDC049753]|uniref:hypothetical protein n=1 Tax=Actinomadura sp. NPDC049753 TaxID=3154739 RepID=UPI0034478AF8
MSEAGFDHDRFALYVWRSVRTHGDTKTKKSRRTLELPAQAADALRRSDRGAPLETIADLVGHAGTAVTEKVYRHQLRPVITKGAETMNTVFGQSESA